MYCWEEANDGKNRLTTEQIIIKLCEEEIALAQGKAVGEGCRQLGVRADPWSNEFLQGREEATIVADGTWPPPSRLPPISRLTPVIRLNLLRRFLDRTP